MSRLRPRRAALSALATAVVVAVAGCAGGGGGNEPGGAQPINRLQVMAPADPGGGWDQTARALAAATDTSSPG